MALVWLFMAYTCIRHSDFYCVHNLGALRIKDLIKYTLTRPLPLFMFPSYIKCRIWVRSKVGNTVKADSKYA